MDYLRNPFTTQSPGAGSKRQKSPTDEDQVMTPGARSLVNDFQRADAAEARRDPLKEQITALTHRKTQIGYAKQAAEQMRDTFLTGEGADLFEADFETGKVKPGKDGSYTPKMGMEIDSLRQKSGETVGFLTGALTPAVRGEPTAAALESRRQLAEREPVYKAKMDKWNRIQEHLGRIQKAGDETEAELGTYATQQLQRDSGIDLGFGAMGTPPAPTAPQPSQQRSSAVEQGSHSPRVAGSSPAAAPITPGQPASQTLPGLKPDAAVTAQAPVSPVTPPAGPTPLALVKLRKEIERNRTAIDMPTTSENLRVALKQKNERMQEMLWKGMTGLPSDQFRQRVIEQTGPMDGFDSTNGGIVTQTGKALARGATAEGIYAGGEGIANFVGNLVTKSLPEIFNKLEELRDMRSGLSPQEVEQRKADRAQQYAKRSGDAVKESGLLRKIGEYADTTKLIRQNIRTALEIDQQFAESKTGQIAQGFGQMAGTVAAGVTSGPAGVAAMSIGQIYDEGYQDAKQSGADDATAHSTAMKYLPAASLDFLSDNLIVGKLLKPLVGKITVGRFIKEVLVSGAVEGTTEGAQQLYLNQVAKRLQGYDPDRPFDQEVYDSILVGAIVGGGVTAVGEGVKKLGEEKQQPKPAPADPSTPQAKQGQPVAQPAPVAPTPAPAAESAQPATPTAPVASQDGKTVSRWTFTDKAGTEQAVDATGLKDALSKLPEGYEPDLKKTPRQEAIAAPADHATPQDLSGKPIDKEWTAFSPESNSLGIPRAEMPQVKAEHRGALTQFLKGKGIESVEDEVLPGTLKPTQAEFSPAKVDKARGFEGGDRAILVSADGHVVDGHHQWMAKLTDEPNAPMRVIRLDAPIKDLIETVKEFPSSETTGKPISQPAASVTVKPAGAEATKSQAKPAGELPSQGPERGAGSAPNSGSGVEATAPAIPRGQNSPVAFTKAATTAAKVKPTDKAGRAVASWAKVLHRANPKEFANMEVHSLTQAQWDAHEKVGVNTPDSAGAYDPDTNTLYINSDKSSGDEIVNTIVHEGGHFAEKYYLGEKFTQGEWESLYDDQREKAARQYNPEDTRDGIELIKDRRARSEWVAMQISRVIKKDTAGMSNGLKAKIEKFLSDVRELVTKWIGNEDLSTEALDAKILVMLGNAEEAGVKENLTTEKPAPDATNAKPLKQIVGKQGYVASIFTSTSRKTPGFNVIVRDVEGNMLTNRVGVPTMKRAEEAANELVNPKTRKTVGKNPSGQDVEEDENGVRSTLTGGIRVTESVQIIPTREGIKTSVNPDTRSEAFMTTEEIAARKGAQKPDSAPLAKLKDTVTGAIERGEKEPIVEKPASPKKPGKFKVSDDLKQAGDALFGTPATPAGFNRKFGEKISQANNVVGMIVRDNPEINSRALLAEFIAEAFPRAKPYSESLFSILSGAVEVDPTGSAADWDGLYAKIDNPGKTEDVAPSEPSPQSPEAGNGQSPRVESRPERTGDRAGVGEQQPGAGPAVGGGQQPSAEGEGSAGTGGRVASEGEGRRDDAPGGSRNLRDLRGSKSESRVTSAGNYVITPEDQIGSGGLRTKYRDNIAAIKLLKQITAENRPATVAEQRLLVRYVGWGGLKSAFNASSKDWSKEFAELKGLLTDEEYKAARATVQDAHYTSETVITRGIYSAMRRFGFTGGNMVEGGVGLGHFIGLMPAEMRGPTSYLGVERDQLTAKIAQLLYPQARILNQSFQDSNLAPGSFDAAVGNPPFGDKKVFDKNFKEASKHSIHNFFILKQLELLRPGGVAGFVVSRYFMDAQDSSAREAIAAKAEFLGAIRLPNTAFKQNANTEVTTDIVFFRRVPDGQTTKQDWVTAVQVKDAATGKTFTMNGWLHARPDMMLGKMGLTGSMYTDAEPTLEPKPNQDLGADLTAAVENLPQNIYQPGDPATTKRLSEPNPLPPGSVPSDAKVGGYFADEKGNLHRRLSDVNEERRSAPVTELKEGAMERIKAILPVRDALNRLVKAEFDAQSTDERLAAMRKTLNKVYDAFVNKFGYLNQPVNRRAFYDDPESARLLGLESNYDVGVSAMLAKKNGVTSREPSAQKAAIFSKRVNAPYTEVTSVETANEALAVSLNQRGDVDLEYMAQLSGKTPAALVEELGGLIFNTPRSGYQSKDQYLSGNVRQKLAEAQIALSQTQDPQWKRNVDALQAVIPADIPATDIAAPVGAPWVPASDVTQFAREITARAPDTVLYRKHDGGWLFRHEDNSVASTQTYGTARANFGEIFGNLLNGRPTLVYDKDSEGKAILNQQETALAAAKAEEIKAKWEEWIWQDQDRRDRLARFYNDNFNNYVDPDYDGSHLTLPGSNPAVQLRQHQKNVIWRTITDRRVLYDHVVGAGKTFAGIGSFMEMRRMGRVRKPLFVVPNHLTGQWRDEFLKLYPSANVLSTQPADFDKDSRGKLFAKILTGEYDAIIIGHSQFKKIGVSPEIEKQLLQEMVAEISEAIEAMKTAEGRRGRSSRPVANAEKTKDKLEERLKKLAEVGERDTVATFEELGIDGLFVDEAHEFKNLFYTTQMQRVAGLGNAAGSQKAFDLYLKTRYLQRRFSGKAPLVFATGTPISNSLVEMFTMQRYLQGEVLEGMGLKSLDAWAKVFGEVAHVYEVDPTGTGYRMATRLAQFQNVGELSALYRTVADVITMTDLEEQAQVRGERFPVPKVKGGKPTNFVADRTKEQSEYFGIEKQEVDEAGNPKFDAEGNPVISYPPGTILHRVDHMPNDPRVDNMLKLTNDARKAGLDMRLIDPSMPDRPESKINKAVSEITDIYEKWTADKGTQLVFCDLSVPASARGKATKKAREQADEFYFREAVVPGGGTRLQAIEGAKPVELPGFTDFKFFSYKNERGLWMVVERTTGKSVGVAESTMKAAVEAAAARMVNIKNFADIIKQQAQPEEMVAQARGEWEASQETAKAETEQPEGEQGVSVDELLADQSKFSVYDDMKAKLIAAGIPQNEIAFIHDYDTPDKKAKLFKAMNRGDIRILFGSTPKLGAGTNVQERLVALHHLDAPWRPSDLEQREGRIVRQGNLLYMRDPDGFEVTINRYATKQTYDTRMWQILEHKARGIEGFRKADRSTRRIADVSGEAANASDMKAAASGDPLIQREIELRNERQKLELLKKAWTNNRHEMQGRAKWLQESPTRHKSAIDLANERIAQRQAKPDPFTFTKADGTVHEGKDGMAQIVAEAVKAAAAVENKKGDADLGAYRGFSISVQRNGFSGGKGFSVFAKPASGKGNWSEVTNYTADDTISDVGFVQRVDNWLDNFDAAIESADRVLANEQKQLADTTAELAKSFAQDSKLTAVREEHEKTRTELMNKKKRPTQAPTPQPPADSGPMGTPAATTAAPQTATAAFKVWFGDSKVVDAEGKPLVVYHGTNQWEHPGGKLGDFDVFERDKSKIMGGKPGFDAVGSWFSSTPDAASLYGKTLYPVYLSIKNPARMTFEQFLVAGQKGDPNWTSKNLSKRGEMPSYMPKGKWNPEGLRQELKSKGYDGIVFPASEKIDGKEQTVFVALEPTQIKSAIGNRGTFDANNPSILGTPPVRGTARQEEVLNKVTGTLDDKRTFGEKITDYIADLGDYIHRELQQKLLDRFTAVKRLERAAIGTNELDASVSAYKWSRLTSNLAGVMEYLMKHGQIAYRGGSMVMSPGTKSLVDILKPVVESGKLRLWEGYVAAYRANRLLAEGKEKNFGKRYDPATDTWSWDRTRAQDEINALLELGRDYPEFEQVRQDYVAFQKSVLDLATAAGLIDPVKRAMWERSDYVPFYRIVEALDGKDATKGPSRRRGFSGQSAGIRQLKGGPQQVAILENIFRNIEQLVDASFKNVAMQRIADLADQNTDLMVKIPYKSVPFKVSFEETVASLEKAGVDTSTLTQPEIEEMVTFWRMRAPEGKDIAMVMNGGKPSYYRVKDKPLLRSIMALGPDQHSWWMKALMQPKHMLTTLVTLDPAFMAANTIRDSFSAWVIADTPIKPGWDAMRGFAKSLANDPVKLGIMVNGGGTGHYNNVQETEVRQSFLRMTREERDGFLNSIIDSPIKLARLYRDIGRATENANRIAIAESAAARGASPAEAAFQALDIMDFGLRGDSKALTFFLDTVPFLNARIQGLYRLGRGLTNDPKRVATHGAIIMGATLALLAANLDDDRYWELPEWDRDMYYHLWFGDRHIRIPKPFEVGQIFSTLPERFTQVMAKDGDKKLFARRMLSMIADTFAMNPIPQALKPLAERAMNLNMLTGGKIISRGDEFKPPEQQFGNSTSLLSREVADAMPDKAPDWMRSPKTLDFLIRGYFGTLGTYAVDSADAVIRGATGKYPDKPERKMGDYWLIRRFAPESDTRESKFVGEFYELHGDISKIMAQVKTMRERGDTMEANEVIQENRDLLGYYQTTGNTMKAMNALRKQERDIYENPRSRTPEQRRKELAEIADKKNRLAKQAVTRAPRRPVPIYNPFSTR